MQKYKFTKTSKQTTHLYETVKKNFTIFFWERTLNSYKAGNGVRANQVETLI